MCVCTCIITVTCHCFFAHLHTYVDACKHIHAHHLFPDSMHVLLTILKRFFYIHTKVTTAMEEGKILSSGEVAEGKKQMQAKELQGAEGEKEVASSKKVSIGMQVGNNGQLNDKFII